MEDGILIFTEDDPKLGLSTAEACFFFFFAALFLLLLSFSVIDTILSKKENVFLI